MAKITITSSKKEQLDFIEKVRQFLDNHTEEQLDALPKIRMVSLTSLLSSNNKMKINFLMMKLSFKRISLVNQQVKLIHVTTRKVHWIYLTLKII